MPGANRTRFAAPNRGEALDGQTLEPVKAVAFLELVLTRVLRPLLQLAPRSGAGRYYNPALHRDSRALVSIDN